jgi:hypothetical protein
MRTGEGWLVRFGFGPKRKKAQPISLTDWAGLWFVTAAKAAYLMGSVGSAHLLSLSKIWLQRFLTTLSERCSHIDCGYSG